MGKKGLSSLRPPLIELKPETHSKFLALILHLYISYTIRINLTLIGGKHASIASFYVLRVYIKLEYILRPSTGYSQSQQKLNVNTIGIDKYHKISKYCFQNHFFFLF